MLSAALYARVRIPLLLAHETAGAARTRCSLRPLLGEVRNEMKTSGALGREKAEACLSLPVILRCEPT